jgi:Amidohydrolase
VRDIRKLCWGCGWKNSTAAIVSAALKNGRTRARPIACRRHGPARPRLAEPSRAASHPESPQQLYQRRLYYDSVAGSEEALRFLLDQVGADRLVLGIDWPFVPWHPSPVTWVQGLKSLTRGEKERILWRNLEALLGV